MELSVRKVTGDGGDWALRLGQRQRTREEAAACVARAEHEAADRVLVETRVRWLLVVDAITSLIAAYNSGAGRPVLTLAKDLGPSDGALIAVESNNEEHPFLSARLEGALICVSARDAQGVSYHGEHRMISDRSDEATAAYLLQNWMERL